MSRRRSLWRRAETTVILAVLVGAGVAITLKVAPTSPPAAIGPLPEGAHAAQHQELAPSERGLVFDRTEIDLGRAADQAEVRAEFRFRNRSDRDIRIDDVHANCGCLQPETDREVYAPGEAGVLVLRVQTAQQAPGPHVYHAELRHDGPGAPTRLTLRVDLTPAVVVRPPALFAYLLTASDTPTEHVIEVIDGRQFPLTILDAVPDSPFLTAELLPVTQNDSGAVVFSIKITVRGGLPSGRHDLSLRIVTSDHEYAEINVPVVLLVN